MEKQNASESLQSVYYLSELVRFSSCRPIRCIHCMRACECVCVCAFFKHEICIFFVLLKLIIPFRKKNAPLHQAQQHKLYVKCCYTHILFHFLIKFILH